MKKRYQISYQLRVLLNVAIYIVFFAYIVYSAVTAADTGTRLIYIVVGVFFGGGALLYEYLRFNFDQATKNLVFMGDPKKALAQAERVKKADILKTFDSSLDIMRMLAYVDLRDYDRLGAYIEGLTYEKLRNYDVVLVARHSQMTMYGELGNEEKMETAHKQLMGLRGRTSSKGKHMKGAYFYNWDVVAAAYSFYRGSGMEAWNRIAKADVRNMNKRELMHCYALQARIAAKIGRTGDMEEYRERAKKAAGKNEAMISFLNELKMS